MQSNMNEFTSAGFRIEMTCKGMNIAFIYNILAVLSNPKNFKNYDYEEFKEIYLCNLLYLNSLIKANTLDGLISSVVAETVLKEFYLKGTLNTHFLPPTFNLQRLYSNNLIKFDESFKDKIVIPKEDGIKMIKYLISKGNYLQNTCDPFLTILNRFLSIYETANPFHAVKNIYLQYIEDYTHYYKLEEDIILNYEKLSDINILRLKHEEGSMSLCYFFNHVFLGQKPKTNMMSYFYLTNFFIKQFCLTQKQTVNYLFSFVKRHGFNIGFLHRSKPIEDRSTLTLLDLDNCNKGNEGKHLAIRSLKTLTAAYLKRNKIKTIYAKGRSWEKKELIRYLNGLIRYANNRFKYLMIYTDFVYGFYFTRPARNALNDAWKTLKNRDDLYTLIKEAICWKPELFPLEDHLIKITCPSLKSAYTTGFSRI